MSQEKSGVTFPATTFLSDPIFHSTALIRYKISPNRQLPLCYWGAIHRRALAIPALGSVGFILMTPCPDLFRSHQPMGTGKFQPPLLTSQMASEAELRVHSQHLLFCPHHLQSKTSSWELMSTETCRDFLLLLLSSQGRFFKTPTNSNSFPIKELLHVACCQPRKPTEVQ